MTRTLSSKGAATFWLVLTALGYFLLASLSLRATKGANDIAAIWPPSGYFLALLLLMPARARVPAFVGAALASVSANMLGGASAPMAAVFTLANAVEAGIAVAVIARREAGELSFMDPRSVGTFCLAALAASLASAGIATGGRALLHGAEGLDFFRSWMTTVGLGMLIVTPPIVMLARLVGSRALDHVSRAMKVEAVAILTAAAVIAAASFSQAHFPSTFLPCVAVVAAAYRLGPFGAAAGMFVVAIVSAWLTGRGYGPIAAIDGSEAERVLYLQFYLVTLLFTSLPLAALLVVQRRLARGLAQSNHWLLQAEAAALVGHWRVDLVRWTIYWSDQTYRIHGLEPGSEVSVVASLDHYLPEDSLQVNAILEQAVRTGEPFEYQGRILRADGAVRYVKSHGTIERNRKGRSVGIFGTIQDVTETVENARVLETARRDAERAANTDMLTGLPNRRHMLASLEEALAQARIDGTPLAVAIFDIDHFKRINDQYGHAVGDTVIRGVGRRARASLRDQDMVGRFGGEEFVCIFRDTPAEAAERSAERVRSAIEQARRGVDGIDGPAHVTISVGLAIFNSDAGAEELLLRADKALYRAKSDGRNRLRLAA